MSDDEGRLEEAREEAAIERCLRNGTMIECPWCGYPTSPYFTVWDDDKKSPMCRKCRDRREEVTCDEEGDE